MEDPSTTTLGPSGILGREQALPCHDQDATASDDLKAIRALLQSIITHHSMRILDAATPRRVSGDEVDPMGITYDEDGTTDYQIGQQPTQWTFVSRMWNYFTFHMIAPSLTRRLLAPGWTAVLSWSIDAPALAHGRLEFNEFGYDADGFPCRPLMDIDTSQKAWCYSPRLEIEEHLVCSLPPTLYNV